MTALPKPEFVSGTDNTNKHGTYLKPGMLKRDVTVVIDNRPANKSAEGNGPAPGNFGKVDVPFSIDGRRFIHSVSPASKDYADACAMFGPNPEDWIGGTVMFQDSPVLNQISMRAIRPAGESDAPTAPVVTPAKRAK